MRNAVIASAALMASSALAQGTAHVVNACKYDVHMSNTPAMGGGYEAIDQVLSSNGGSYSQPWTELSNGMGWSIKLAKTPSYQTNLMQYEYTFHDDGIIWYDLSEVDGNPWEGDWMITATGDCNPKQQAYRFSTDDAYGMQSCPDSAEITVTLCSGEDQADGEVSSAASSAGETATSSAGAEPSSYAAPSSSSAEATTESPAESTPSTTATGGWGGFTQTWGNRAANRKDAEITASPTTLVTQRVSVSDAGDYDVTVTDVATEVVTAYVTAKPAPKKRHEHHVRHPHERRQE